MTKKKVKILYNNSVRCVEKDVCSKNVVFLQENALHKVVVSLRQTVSVVFYDAQSSEVTKKCRLSWPTNSALVYKPKCGGEGGCGVSAYEYSCTQEPK